MRLVHFALGVAATACFAFAGACSDDNASSFGDEDDDGNGGSGANPTTTTGGAGEGGTAGMGGSSGGSGGDGGNVGGSSAGGMGGNGSGGSGGVMTGGGGAGGVSSTCDACLMSMCMTEYNTCQATTGCEEIVLCALMTGCTGIDCYMPGTCQAVIDMYGGIAGPATSAAIDLGNCAATNCPGDCP
jgi:hypothetical protein